MTTCPKCNVEMLKEFVATQKLPIVIGIYKFNCRYCKTPLNININVQIGDSNTVTLQ